MYTAVHQNKWQDYLTGSIVILVAIPNFILGPPLRSFCFPCAGFLLGWGGMKQLILPAFSLGLTSFLRVAADARRHGGGAAPGFHPHGALKGLSESAVI